MPVLRLRLGDSLDVLAALPAGSVGAVLTDPPYGLSLASWDASVPTTWLPLAFRVLQPGGVLKAFSASRTFHRLAAGMEQSGFECIHLEAWAYSSGFPKGGDLGRQVDREVEHGEATRARVLRVTRWIAARLRVLGLRRAALDAAAGTVGMSSHWATAASQPEVPTAAHWPAVLRLLGEPPDDVAAIVAEWHEAHPTRAAKMTDDRVFGSYGRSTAGPAARCVPSTAEGRAWAGWSTTLRPAWEPVLVGRKPRGNVDLDPSAG